MGKTTEEVPLFCALVETRSVLFCWVFFLALLERKIKDILLEREKLQEL
jgi:hypothetical protein